MSSLRDIKQHLRSVENIKKITDAMERVAAARLRRAQAKAEESRPYVNRMKMILEHLSTTDHSHPLFEKRIVKKTALIVISADRGLSGSYNTNLLHATNSFLKKYSHDQIELILFGRKAVDHFRQKKWTIAEQLTDWGGKITFDKIKEITDFMVDSFLEKKYDEVWVIYTHYKTIMHREVITEKFLSIGKPHSESPIKRINYIFEPDAFAIYSTILERYCISILQKVLNESYASELAARIVAMQTANKNSEMMIESLTITRNKVRQEGITREIIEVASGAQR